MKLLPKSEIHQKKALEQKQTIDEGVKITRRIDSLREIMASEEQTLEKFRSETLQQIHKETTEACNTRDALLGEVRELEAAKREALKPLTEEQKLIDEAREDIARKAAQNVTQAATIEATELAIREKEKETDSVLLMVKMKEDRVTQELREADTKHQTAQQLLTEASEIHQNSVILKETTETSITERQTLLDQREQTLRLNEEALDKERQAVARDRVLVNDRMQALEREFNRLKT